MSESHSPSIVSPAPKVEGETTILTLGDTKKADKYRFGIYQSNGKTWAKVVTSPRNEAFEVEAKLGKAFPFSSDSWKLK
jgi:hypothetical protein